jgi:hypothetical protein
VGPVSGADEAKKEPFSVLPRRHSMKALIQKIAFAALALVVIAGPAAAGEGKGKGTWVSDSGNVHAVHSGNAVFISDDGAERFDLSDLSDGETRTFGAGTRAVTVSRQGDIAVISRQGSGDDVSTIDVKCILGEDTCTVLTFPEDSERVMVAIEKERICVNGEGDCDHSFGVAHGEGHVIVDIDCDGDDCGELHEMHGLAGLDNTFTVETTGDGDEHSRIMIRRVGDPGAKAENVFVTKAGAAVGGMHRMHTLHGDDVMLTCSEGDATIMVKKEEKDDTFLCPKHSTPMEQVKGHGGSFRVIRSAEPHEH